MGSRSPWGVVTLTTVSVAWVALGLWSMAAAPPGMAWQPYIARQFWIGAVMVPVGAWLAWARPVHRLGWVFLVAGGCSWLSFSTQPVLTWLFVHRPAWEGLARTLLALTIWGWLAMRLSVMALVPLCYPGPRPVGILQRALWWTAVTGIVVVCAAHARVNTFETMAGEPVGPGLAHVADLVEPWATHVVSALAVIALATMIARVVRLPADARRRHLPFAVTALLLVVPHVETWWSDVVGHHVWNGSEEVLFAATLALPLVLLLGVLLDGLMDDQADVAAVARRSTVYAATLAILAVLYVTVVRTSSTLVAGETEGGRLLATGLVAAAVVPVHVRVHGVVDRRLFGRRRDPRAVLAEIDATVRGAPQGVAALELVCRTLVQEFRVPFVAVELSVRSTSADSLEIPDARTVRVAESGPGATTLERFELVVAGDVLGDLVVGRRSAGEPFDRGEEQALMDIAQHVAVLATNVALTTQLDASRRQLVTAREEERRRIRRDLHDGLGPTLASVCLGLGAASERIGTDSELGAFLDDLDDELHTAVDDLRRLVYDLRPPALDELGLVDAVRDHVGNLARAAPGATMEVAAEGIEHDTSLPAAVEVAAYRIALEAVTNVTRHSSASHCWIRFREHGQVLEVEVEDDGTGIGPDRRQGVGLRSMRDRALELGGELLVRPRVPSGTSVVARLPLHPGVTS